MQLPKYRLGEIVICEVDNGVFTKKFETTQDVIKRASFDKEWTYEMEHAVGDIPEAKIVCSLGWPLYGKIVKKGESSDDSSDTISTTQMAITGDAINLDGNPFTKF